VPFASTVSVAVSPEAIVRLSGSLVIVGATAGAGGGTGGNAGGGVEGGGSGGATTIVAVTESMLAVAS